MTLSKGDDMSKDGHDELGRFTKDNPGRKPGWRNRVTKDVVEHILESLEHRGGVRYLDGLPDRLFVPLLSRVLPRDVHVEHAGKLSWAEMIEKLRAEPGDEAAVQENRE